MTEEQAHKCPYCDKVYKTKNALSGHLAVCKAKPDEEEDEPIEEEEGISLFDDDEPEPKKSKKKEQEEEEDDEGYQCGGCAYVSKSMFRVCPKCGAENEW